ncbi:MAG: sodium:calcium antiporter [Candidatus Aenigmatarchaeota archaeon]
MIVEIFLLLASLGVVALMSDRVITYVSRISHYLGISEMSAGFIILALSTSLPELFIAIMSALSGQSNLSVGNVIGANIANLTLVAGLAIIISKASISIKSASQKSLSEFLFLTSLIALFIVQRNSLGPMLGAVLLIMFVYFIFVISKKTGGTKPLGYFRSSEIRMTAVKFIVSIAVLLIASKLIVDNGVSIATQLGLPLSIIGATIISIGTTIPELTTTIQALRKHHQEMAMGNILGSCITNLTLILGLNALLSFSQINLVAAGSMIFFMLFSTIVMWHMINSECLNRKYAIILILIYMAFILQQLGFSLFLF